MFDPQTMFQPNLIQRQLQQMQQGVMPRQPPAQGQNMGDSSGMPPGVMTMAGQGQMPGANPIQTLPQQQMRYNMPFGGQQPQQPPMMAGGPGANPNHQLPYVEPLPQGNPFWSTLGGLLMARR